MQTLIDPNLTPFIFSLCPFLYHLSFLHVSSFVQIFIYFIFLPWHFWQQLEIRPWAPAQSVPETPGALEAEQVQCGLLEPPGKKRDHNNNKDEQ